MYLQDNLYYGALTKSCYILALICGTKFGSIKHFALFP